MTPSPDRAAPTPPVASTIAFADRTGTAGRVRALRVEHETRYDYEDEVEIAHHLGHLRPRGTPWQQVRDWRLEVDPVPEDSPGARLPEHAADHPRRGASTDTGFEDDRRSTLPAGARLSADCWGNWRVGFSHARVHDHLIVRSTFVARLLERPAPEVDTSPAWERVVADLGYRPGEPFEPASEFALPTRLAPRDPALAAFAAEVFRPGRPVAASAVALMHLVHERFEYKPASTSVNTLATEALALRRGVCQDFAHVMIGAMRSIGLAARYVSGYLLTRPPPGRPRLVGADATHAWIEAWCPVNGWIGLDPTNGVLAGQDHVTVAWGRDYSDVAPLRGIIRGGGKVLPRVAVTVEPVDAGIGDA